MGSHYNSLSLPSDRMAETRDLLVDWYGRKGFTLSNEKPLFDDGDDPNERGAIVATDGRWTVVLASHLEEMDRLAWELQSLGGPLLELSLYASDVWTYRLLLDRREVETFCSNPSYFGRGREMETGPPGARRLCELCGLAGQEPVLARIQRERRLFAEGTVKRFAAAIGAPAAATQFKYALEEAEIAPEKAPLRGYRFERLLFEKGDAPKSVPVHADAFPRRHRPTPNREPRARPPVPLELRVQIAATRALFFPIAAVFRILLFIARLVGSLAAALPSGSKGKPANPMVRLPRRFEVRDGFLVSTRYPFRVALKDGVVPSDEGGMFRAFAVSGLAVTFEAVRPTHAQRVLSLNADDEVTDDARYFAGDLPVRGLVWRTERTTKEGRRYVQLVQREVVATPRALYAFTCFAEDEMPADVIRKVRNVVETFEMTEDR